MHFEVYQKAAIKTSKMSKADRWYFALGLCGEAGEVAEKVKKHYRDDKGTITLERREAIKNELGDTLWYLSMVASAFGINLEDVATSNLEKLAVRDEQGLIHGDGDNR